jgi:hypothetical protein
MVETIMSKAWSSDGEMFYGDREMVAEWVEEGAALYEGDSVPYVLKVNGSHVLEIITECIADNTGDCSENYCDKIMTIDHKLIAKAVEDIILKEVGKPDFFDVENVKEVPL